VRFIRVFLSNPFFEREKNIFKMSFNFKVNKEQVSSDNKIISGSEILKIAGFEPEEDFDLYKKIHGHEYEPIQLDENVDLEEPGIEKFKVSARKAIKFDVDDEEYQTENIELTPIEIFKIIGLDSSKFYLKQIKGHLDITYKNDEHKSINMLGYLKFITCKKEAATVS
jgi:Multiubiquitin